MHSPGRPSSPTGDMVLGGIYYAVVTQIKDDELKLGRIKVKFPWLPGSDQDESAWAQLMVPMAGAEFGTYTLPEVDDVVAVMFLSGEINYPIIVGGVWSSVDVPPEVNENGKNDFRFIKSRSGHRMLLDDSAETKVVLTDNDNTNYAGVGSYAEGGDSPNKMKLEAPSAINGNPEKGVAIASMQGTVNIWCPNGTLDIKAKDVEITASQKGNIKAGGELKLEGGANAEATSTGPGKYEGSTIKVGP
ncbi:phage baseplate assembly protein V [Haliangium sp.]|uniref:phage baseplate assembly protein V n=1 Tax=Haliangium sp. TaxID=2663208 RepID=UPI003D0ABD9A